MPAMPCQMSINGQNNNNQINQFIDLDPNRNINQLINIGKFGNIDLNGLTQNALNNPQQQPQEQLDNGLQPQSNQQLNN